MAGSKKATARKTAGKKATRRRKSARKAASKSAKAKSSPRKSSARKSSSRKRVGRKTAARKTSGRPTTNRWSRNVTEHSDALDLKQGVFKQSDPKKIAASLKRSAEHSARRKTGAYRSALSMLTFYINRAGDNLPKAQRARLERAKDELKKAFGKE